MAEPAVQTTPAPEVEQRKPGQIMAQGIYMAQLAALKGNCKCNTCKIMRKISDAMSTQFANSPDGFDLSGVPVGEIVTLPGAGGETAESEE